TLMRLSLDSRLLRSAGAGLTRSRESRLRLRDEAGCMRSHNPYTTATLIISDMNLRNWMDSTVLSLRKQKEFVNSIDMKRMFFDSQWIPTRDILYIQKTETAENIRFILTRYGSPDREENDLCGNRYYWYGPIAIIVRKDRNVICGLAGNPPEQVSVAEWVKAMGYQITKPRNHPLPMCFEELLTGRNEVRVRNPNDFVVTVGLRQGKQGKDIQVPANGVQSVSVPDGKYDIYFVYSSKPDALFQGDSFTLTNNGVEIQIVKVVNGNYNIKQVK
ncbi:MAG: hypothetical protein ACYC7E_09205, partial [Armatimonadota bacterium]